MKLSLARLVAACALSSLALGQNPTKPQPPSPKNQVPSTPAAAATSTGGSNHRSFVSGGSDSCATATPISGTGPFAGDNIGATTDGPSNCGQLGNDVWYDWTAGFTGSAIFSLCGSPVTSDTVMSVYDGPTCTGALLGCNDDFCAGFGPSQVTALVVNGSVYKIQIGGYQGGGFPYSLSITAATPPPPPPANDLCSSPTSISGNGPFNWNNVSALTDGGTETCGIPNQDVWYAWVAPLTGPYQLSLCAGSSMDTVVAVYAGAGCPSAGSAIACDDDFCTFAGPSQAAFAATGGSTYMIRIGGFGGAEGSGTFTIGQPPPPPPNDDCATPIAVSGAGPFNFDNTMATTGSQGQNESLCNFFLTTGIDNDIWFTWTATASGAASISTCGQTTMDSKIAVYAGAGCPSSPALACNDDSCSSLRSTACLPVTSGQTYTIQLGNYPGTNGSTGTFSISVTAGGSACQYDDGSSENLYGWSAGGDMAWLQSFGSSGGGSTNVSNIEVAWGSLALPGYAPPNGSPARVAIWDDPNDDGDPSDAVLLQVVNTAVANVDTDVMNTIAITPVSVNGVFFVGASEAHNSGQKVAVMDQNGCIASGHQWLFGNDGNNTPADLANPLNNLQTPATFDSQGYPCNLLVRPGCNLSPLSAFCLPGQGGVHACPCSNPPAGNGLGCDNFGAGPADSATLTGAGNAAIAADTLVFTSTGENNTSFTIFAQGTIQLPAGVVFGAGVRCVAGVLKRLYVGNAVAGTIVRPSGSDLSVHLRSAALGYVINPPITLYYFAYYRDPLAAVPCGSPTATFNSTQAGAVLWQ